MPGTPSSTGFVEIEHASDKSIEVWGLSLDSLFEQAALGMYHLMGARLLVLPKHRTQKTILADDLEGMLIAFLTELIFLIDNRKMVLLKDSLHITKKKEVIFSCGIMQKKDDYKPIKAVTYHGLEIKQIKHLWRTQIIFDV